MSTLHRIAAMIALIAIALFMTATVTVETFGTGEEIAQVKRAILYGLILLIPALAATGASGFRLARSRNDRAVATKRRRMPIIVANGLLVLVPLAFYLEHLAARGVFGALFYALQGLELAAGSLNLVLMGLNVRDGHRARKGREPVKA